jgi:hypothetical protein
MNNVEKRTLKLTKLTNTQFIFSNSDVYLYIVMSIYSHSFTTYE